MKNFKICTLAFLLLAVSATPLYAAELSIEAPLGSAGSPILLPVVFTAGDESVNVVEGSIAIPEGMTIEHLDTSGSAFPLFASGPTYMPSSHTVEFTAGSETGIGAHEVALVFVIQARAEREATYEVSPGVIAAYASDGAGTKVAVAARTAHVSIGPKGGVQVDALPKGAPRALLAEIGKEDSLFEGKWFLTFFGGTHGAPIERYEVREGWWRFPVSADRYYVLKDQARRTTLFVTAIDTNGNRTSVLVPPAYPWAERAVLFAIALIAAVAAYLLMRRLRKNK